MFLKAEDGIGDVAVTGVQTCALPILPDPVPRRGGRHRLPPGARDRGWRTGWDDGRRWGEVRRVADDGGTLLGRRTLGRTLLRGPRVERGLADHDHPFGLAGDAPAARARLRPGRKL